MLYITKIITKAIAIILGCLEAHPPGENAGDQVAAVNVHGEPFLQGKSGDEWLTLTFTFAAHVPNGATACIEGGLEEISQKP